jgi:tetratricopeptide (TPR) repeat protein
MSTASGGAVSEGEYLSIDDRIRLLDAVAAVEPMRDPGLRRQVLSELNRELSPEFNLGSPDAIDADVAAIFRECERLGALWQLVRVVRLVGGASEAVVHLETLAGELIPQLVLTPAEQRRLEELFGTLPRAVLQEILAAEKLRPYQNIDAENAAKIIQLFQASTKDNDDDARLAFLIFLELCSHRSDTYVGIQAHQIVHKASARSGLGPKVDNICHQLSAGTLGKENESPDVSDESHRMVMPTLVPPTSGEIEVRIPTLPTATSDSTFEIGPAIMGGVPPQNPNFTGRETMLENLKAALRESNRAAVLPHTLHGLGGVGKSQLAIEYARRFQAEYELIWWIPADDDISIRRSFVSLARRLNLPESNDWTYTVETVLESLRLGRPTPNWLLIYDGADEPAKLHSYLPSGSGHVLITSRNQSWVNQSTVIEVDVFEVGESIEFLTRRWEGISTEDARLLAEELGHLPLALDQAAAVHTETGMTMAEYLRLLKASPGQVLAEGTAGNYPHSVARTWRLAYDKLIEESPAAAQLLEVCSFLSSQPIAVPMLARGRGARLPDELREALRDDIKMRRAVRDLGRFALAQLDTSRDFIRIHMLVRALVRDGLDEQVRNATERSAHELLALANPGTPDNSVTWSQHAQIAPHVIPSGVIMSDDAHVRRIVLDQIRYFFVIGNYQDSKVLAEHAVETWHGSLGADDEMTLVASFHLGNALRALGEYAQARKINEDTLERMVRVLGPNHEHTLRMTNSHAADLRMVGDFRGAMKLDEENLERHRHILDDADPATLRSANNLAVDYRLIGDFPKARDIDEGNWRRRASVLGENNPEVLSSANSVVRDMYGFGEYQDALSLEREILAKYEPLLPGHAFVLLARRNLAILLRKTGKYPEATSLSESNYRLSSSQFGPEHEQTLAAMMTLSNALRLAGDLPRALSTGEEALSLYGSNLGAEHPFTLACAVNLAIVLRASGDLGRAHELDNKTLETLRRVVGPDHPYALCAASNMSNDLARMARSEEARAVSAEVLERSRRARVPDHPYTLACAVNLALDLEATGARADAAALRAETIEKLRHKLGTEHPETANAERDRRAECDSEVPSL